MFAIIKTGGKQYKVRVGETIDVEKLDVEEGAQVRLDQVLLAANDGAVVYGRPVIDGAVVTARVVHQHKGPKLIVFRYKSKSRYRRRTGHRQNLTQLSIQTVEIPGWETASVPARRVKAPVAGEVVPVLDETPLAEGASAPVAEVAPVAAPLEQVEATDSDTRASRPGMEIDETLPDTPERANE